MRFCSFSMIPMMSYVTEVCYFSGVSAFICKPGLTFLAIHSNEFIKLIHKRWNVSSKQLWCYPKDEIQTGEGLNTLHNLEFIGEEGKQHGHIGCAMETSDPKQVQKASKLDVFFWYVFGMPLWSNIAQIGRTNLAEHFEKEKMASPSVVKPRRVSIMKSTWDPSVITRSSSDPEINKDSNNTEQTALLRSSLGSPYGSNIVAGDNGVAKMIASANNLSGSLFHRTNSLTSAEVELELQNEVPTWIDFIIAIAYVVLGVVAMTFGLVSVMLL